VRLAVLTIALFLVSPLDKCQSTCPPCPSPTPCPTPTPGPTPTPTPQPTPTPTPEPANECEFPQGVPEGDFTYLGVREPTLGRTVNDAVSAATGCPVGATCELPGIGPNQLFEVVTQRLRDMGLCAGRHDETNPGGSDEIAVAESCLGPWQGYHIYAYTGYAKWSPASYTGDWTIKPVHCEDAPPPPSTCPSGVNDIAVYVHAKGDSGGSSGSSWAAVLDATIKADGAWCRTLVPPRVHCPVPDQCIESVSGPPVWEPLGPLPGRDTGCVLMPSDNPWMPKITGWCYMRVYPEKIPSVKTICQIDEAKEGQAVCAPEVTQ